MRIAKIEIEPHGEGPVIRLSGEVDLSNADELRSDIVQAVPHEASGVVLDLTETTYLDSTGIRLLLVWPSDCTPAANVLCWSWTKPHLSGASWS